MTIESQSEVEQIRSHYAMRDQSAEIKGRWAPFKEDEIWHRNQQQAAMGKLFRSIGWMNFADRRILDVGCGTGRFLRHCIDYDARPESLYGVDLSAERIAKAAELSPNLHFSLGNGETLDFPDNHFDVVTQFVVFSSIYSDDLRRQLAGEMLRVLNPRGYIFWWDALTTVHKEGKTPIPPQAFFPGMEMRSEYVGQGLRGFLSGLRSNPLDAVRHCGASHVAALIGPKAR